MKPEWMSDERWASELRIAEHIAALQPDERSDTERAHEILTVRASVWDAEWEASGESRLQVLEREVRAAHADGLRVGSRATGKSVLHAAKAFTSLSVPKLRSPKPGRTAGITAAHMEIAIRVYDSLPAERQRQWASSKKTQSERDAA